MPVDIPIRICRSFLRAAAFSTVSITHSIEMSQALHCLGPVRYHVATARSRAGSLLKCEPQYESIPGNRYEVEGRATRAQPAAKPVLHRLPRDTHFFQKLIACIAMLSGTPTAYIEPIPVPYGFLETYCLDCHDDFERKAEISLEALEIDWSDHESVELWERVINVLNTGEMPPRKERQPSASERTAMTEWLDDRLLEHSPIGGTALRRLNRREYRSSLNQLFEIDYELLDGFLRIIEPFARQSRGCVDASGPSARLVSESGERSAENSSTRS